MIKVRVKDTDVESAALQRTTASISALARTIGVDPREISFEGNEIKIYREGEAVRNYKITNECLDIMTEIDANCMDLYDEGYDNLGFFSLKKK